MRNLIALSLVFSFGLFADDHADEPEYKPNKAEYYVSVFKDGKDMDDMMAWAEDWAEWASKGDAAEAFAEADGGFYDTNVAAKLVEHLFSVRNAVDPAEAYRAFRGRDANVEALMRDRGFPIPEDK